jgi:hypothetical protein
MIHRFRTVALDHWKLQLWLLVSVVAKVNVEDAVLLGLHMSPLCLTHGWAHQYV